MNLFFIGKIYRLIMMVNVVEVKIFKIYLNNLYNFKLKTNDYFNLIESI